MTTQLLRDQLVERTLGVLIEDYERQDGRLEKCQVDRAFDKRGLSVGECQAVLERLELAGIRLEDAEENTEFLDQFANSESRDVPVTLLEQYTSVASRPDRGDYGLLSGPEELELGRMISLGQRASAELAGGDTPTPLHDSIIERGLAAQRRMTLANLRLVAHVARPFFGMSDLAPDDLIQEGILGLIRATQKFDHTLGLKFSTYATWWIRQAVTRALADRGVCIRLPVYLAGEVHRYRRAYRLLHQSNPARNPSLSALADELAWPIDRVVYVQQLNSLQPTSLEDAVLGDPEARLVDFVESADERPEETAERNSLRKAVASAVGELKESERRVLILRFGLDDFSGGRTLEEVGQQLGVTRERARQIESKALKRLLSRAQRQGNYFLSAYCPERLSRSADDDVSSSPPERSDPRAKKENECESQRATLREKIEPFPREYRWLR